MNTEDLSNVVLGVLFSEIRAERARQESLKKEGKFTRTCADYMTHEMRLSILAEEFGEVAREVVERNISRDKMQKLYPDANLPKDVLSTYTQEQYKHTTHIRKELIQVMAVCVAWVEAIDGDND